jgi:hypothetical protein
MVTRGCCRVAAGTFSMLLFQGIDLQQDALSPGYVPVVAAAPVVPTLGSGVAPGQQFDAASLVAAVTAHVGQLICCWDKFGCRRAAANWLRLFVWASSSFSKVFDGKKIPGYSLNTVLNTKKNGPSDVQTYPRWA